MNKYKDTIEPALEAELSTTARDLIVTELNLRVSRKMYEEKKDMRWNTVSTRLANELEGMFIKVKLAEELLEEIKKGKYIPSK
jgi:hypothetical protein